MYELKRANRIEEAVQLGDEILTVSLTIDAVLKDFNNNFNAVVEAEKQLRSIELDGEGAQIDKAATAYGDAVIGLLNITFGEDNTNKILDFYENNYVEMVSEVFPFILDVIVPEIKKSTMAEKEKLKERYLLTQRRKQWFK